MSSKIALACQVCSSRNYTIPKASNLAKRLELNKYCKHCGKHTRHAVTK